MALLLTASVGCKQTAEDRYNRYLEEVADSSSSDDGKGIYTIPEIPQERKVDMNANTYELEKMMQGKE